MFFNIPIDERTIQVIQKRFNDIRKSISPDRFTRIQNIIEDAVLRKYFISKDIYDILDLLEENHRSLEESQDEETKEFKISTSQNHVYKQKSNSFKQTLIHLHDHKQIRFKQALICLLESHRKSCVKATINNQKHTMSGKRR